MDAQDAVHIVTSIWGDRIAIPEEFCCPITLQVMKLPLTTRTGQNFERSAILSWLSRGNAECPITRRPMKPSDLIPNGAMQTKIQCWMKKHGVDWEEAASGRNVTDCSGDEDEDNEDAEEQGEIGNFYGFLCDVPKRKKKSKSKRSGESSSSSRRSRRSSTERSGASSSTASRHRRTARRAPAA